MYRIVQSHVDLYLRLRLKSAKSLFAFLDKLGLPNGFRPTFLPSLLMHGIQKADDLLCGEAEANQHDAKNRAGPTSSPCAVDDDSLSLIQLLDDRTRNALDPLALVLWTRGQRFFRKVIQFHLAKEAEGRRVVAGADAAETDDRAEADLVKSFPGSIAWQLHPRERGGRFKHPVKFLWLGQPLKDRTPSRLDKCDFHKVSSYELAVK